jgi:hypothetical protein
MYRVMLMCTSNGDYTGYFPRVFGTVVSLHTCAGYVQGGVNSYAASVHVVVDR